MVIVQEHQTQKFFAKDVLTAASLELQEEPVQLILCWTSNQNHGCLLATRYYQYTYILDTAFSSKTVLSKL